MSGSSKTPSEFSFRKRALLDALLKEEGLESSGAGPIPRRRIEGDPALSFAQQRLWFLDQLTPGNPFYNIPSAYRVRGGLDREVLRRALAAVVARHEVLRTTFVEVDERPVQRIAPNQSMELPVVDISGVAEAERKKRTEDWVAAEARRPFDLARGPLLRAGLLRLAEQEHVLVLTIHHIVSDGWSMGIFMQELARFYEEFSGGRPAALPDLPIQYADFASWQREWLSGEVLEKQRAYWKNQLADLPTLELPTDRPRPPEQSFRGARHRVSFSKGLTDGLKDLSRREGATLYMTLLAAFQALLLRYTGQEDVVVGSPIANRTRREIEGLIGFFVNTLVLRTDLSGNPSFRELVGRVREVALQAYAYQDLPFEKLVEELQPERNLGVNPLFQVTLSLQNAPGADLELPGLTLTGLGVENRTTHFDLEVYLWESEGRLNGSFAYATDLFDVSTIERLSRHFEVLLEGVVADPGRKVSQLPLLTEAERRQVLKEWNQTGTQYPREKTVQGLFEEQVERAPEAVAVVCGQERVSYGQLNERANQLARYLSKRGVGPEVLVGLCVERSLEMVVGLLGILKAGGAYVPLDPAYPRQRLAFMLEDTQARVVLTLEGLSEGLLKDLDCVRLDADWAEIARESGENPATQAVAENLAYVIYTSGSTGQPKGVEALHRACVNRFQWMWRTYPFGGSDVCCQKTALSFVDSVWEIFGPLLQGIPSVIVPEEAVRDPRALVEVLASERVTRIVLVPSLLRALLDSGGDLAERLPLLKWWVSSGETLSLDLYRRFRQAMPGAVMINLYGSSEVSADVTCYDSRSREPGESVPIGRPIANTQVYILDEYRQPVPIGVPGELYVGGDGLARGYRNRPGLTAERFVPDPFAETSGARLFKTGDRARYLSDGQIEYLGRRDLQVKISGYRIEIGEIEEALSRYPDVLACAVSVRENGLEKRLVGYVVPRGEAPPSVSGLRSFLKTTLPGYMIPSVFLFLDALPLTPSGKVDRRALPAPDQSRPDLQGAFQTPRNAVEQTLAGIWAQVLGLDRVGVHDNFFDLGGHSLLATQVFSRLRHAFTVGLPLRVLFETPTIAGLAAAIEAAQSAGGESSTSRIVPVSREALFTGQVAHSAPPGPEES